MKIPGFSGAALTPSDFGQPREAGSDWSRASGPFQIQPQLVLGPENTTDVVAAVRWAAQEGRHLTTRAAATGMPGGNVGNDVLLDMGPAGPFAHIGPIDSVEGQVKVGPGAIAAHVDRAARAHGFTLPALPSSAERCTIGGMVANNAAGARSFKHGSIARRVHALTVVDSFGEVHELTRGRRGTDPFATAGLAAGALATRPKVRKNSSGYGLERFDDSGDSVDLLVGSEGTIGIITDVTLKLEATPTESGTVLVGADSDEALMAWTEIARDAGLSACEFIGPWLLERAALRKDGVFGVVAGGSNYAMILEAQGSAEEVADTLSAIESHARAAGNAMVRAVTAAEQDAIWGIRKRASPAIAAAAGQGKRSMQFIEDSVVPPHSLGEYLEHVGVLLDEAGFEAAVFGHAGDANVHINPLVPIGEPDWLDRVRTLLAGTATLVARLGGTLAGEHGDGRVRAPYLAEIWGPVSFGSFQTLKRTLDPNGIFNPGVIVPIAGQDPLLGLLAS